jgi:hypothetical protein
MDSDDACRKKSRRARVTRIGTSNMKTHVTKGIIIAALAMPYPAAAEYSYSYCMNLVDQSEQGMIETFRQSRQLSDLNNEAVGVLRSGDRMAGQTAYRRYCSQVNDHNAYLHQQLLINRRVVNSCLAGGTLQKIVDEYEDRIQRSNNQLGLCKLILQKLSEGK